MEPEGFITVGKMRQRTWEKFHVLMCYLKRKKKEGNSMYHVTLGACEFLSILIT